MAHYTLQQLQNMRKHGTPEPRVFVIPKLIEDLLDAYALLDKQAEEYKQRKEP